MFVLYITIRHEVKWYTFVSGLPSRVD